MTKKNSIIRAALEVLSKRGVHATPMSAIAKEAGTGMGTIYNYFPTKEALLNYIYRHIKTQEQEIFEPFNAAEDIKTQFFNYYKVSTNFFIENQQYFEFMEQLHASPIITQESREYGRNAAKEVFYLIETGQKNGIIKNLPALELLQFIGGAMLSTIRWTIKGGDSDYVNNQLNLVWDAVKA